MTYGELRDILNRADIHEEAVVCVLDDNEEPHSIAEVSHVTGLITGKEKIFISI